MHQELDIPSPHLTLKTILPSESEEAHFTGEISEALKELTCPRSSASQGSALRLEPRSQDCHARVSLPHKVTSGGGSCAPAPLLKPRECIPRVRMAE